MPGKLARGLNVPGASAHLVDRRVAHRVHREGLDAGALEATLEPLVDPHLREGLQARGLRVDEVFVRPAPLAHDVQIERLAHVAVLAEGDAVDVTALAVDRHRGGSQVEIADASLANLTDTAGGLVLPSLHAAEPTLYGRPVYQSPELPAAAANARSVVVGDFSVGYAVRRVTGFGLHRQTEIHSDSGQIGYRLFARVDGRVVLPDALRILTNSAT